jgi:hypothetical protein
LSLRTRRPLIETVNLLRNIREMKIRRERPGESAQSRHIKIIEERSQSFSVPCVYRTAQPPRDRPHTLNEIKQVTPLLTHQGISELVAEPSDISP